METKTTTALVKFKDTQQKVNRLLLQEEITATDIALFNAQERKYLGESCTKKLDQLAGAERETFLDKIAPILSADTNTEIWEYNHSLITNTVSNYMREYGLMPSKSTIADRTKLSRQTVTKHLKEYQQHPEYASTIDQFKLMAPKVLANVFRLALKGDVRAAKLYFEAVGSIGNKSVNTHVAEQNNHIQINNTILSQENIRQLSASQLRQIESIITHGENY